MIGLDRRQFKHECQSCKHKSKEMEWKSFRLDIYQDYPEPCKKCVLNPFPICFEKLTNPELEEIEEEGD